MQREHKIKYCKTCRKFYTRSCSCHPNLINFQVPSSIETCICSALSLIWKFLYMHDDQRCPIKLSDSPINFLSKYIYLDSPSFNYKSKINDVSVCMLTVTSGQDVKAKEPKKKVSSTLPPRLTSSIISMSSKKSAGGNILANLISKTRRKKRKEDCPSDTTLKSRAATDDACFSEDEQSDNSSVQHQQPVISSESKIPIFKPKVNLQKILLMQKFTVKNGSDSVKSRSYVSIAPEKTEEVLKRSKSDADMEPLWKCSYTNTPVLTSQTFDWNAKLGLDLHEVISILSQLKESETHVGHLISKFIDDRSFQKQLLDVVTNHSKLRVAAEVRTQNLSTEMWLYQNEVLKNHETATQERLATVIKHNRMLQNDVEHLMSKNEKLCVKIQQLPNHVFASSDGGLLQVMSRNNDQLRCNVGVLSKQVEQGEVELSKLQKKYVLLQRQSQNFNLQLQSYKDIIDRMQTESRLEQEVLVYEVQNSQRVLKESAEAGDVVLEDLDSLKRQFKCMTCTINWTKFKCRGNGLPDLIYMCRSCINELSKELLHVQNEGALKDKDIDSLKQELTRQEIEKEQTRHDHSALQEMTNLLTIKEAELNSYKVKCNESEEELKKHKEEIQKLGEEYQKENRSIRESIDNLDNLKKEMLEKSEELLLVKEEVSEYKSENDTLRMQVQGLKQVLLATGTGEVARELAETQEKLVAFQSQYYQILSEKNVLIDKLQSANLERATLNQFQASSSQFIQAQQQELDATKKDCSLLKQQFDLEQKQSTALTIELNKLKDEKSVMKQIYAQLKAEVNRVQDLEGKFVGMNVEANRLALIADYNKQLGEKLQSEVVERDVKITELESNMKELNNAQLENSKDKVALCVELKEVCSWNDRLSNSLEFEQQKIDELHQTKKKIEDAASVQLRAAEIMQKKERTVLLELLKEYKLIVAQRDNLLANQTDRIQQITELRANLVILRRNLEESQQRSMQQIQVIQSLRDNLTQVKEELQKMTDALNAEQKESVEMKTENLKVKEQKESLKQSVTYLQNTVQQLHKDLNKTRESEMIIKRELEDKKNKLADLEILLEQNKKTLDSAQKDNDELVQRSTKLNAVYEVLLQNYKHDMEVNNENVESLRMALGNSKDMIAYEKNNVVHLQELVLQKENDIKAKCDAYATLTNDLEQALAGSMLQLHQLAESKAHQELLRSNVDENNEIIKNLKEENDDLQEQVRERVEKTNVDRCFYENYVKELSSKHDEDRKELVQDLETFAVEFEELRSKFAIEEDQIKGLTVQQKQLVEQLLTATQMVVDEKLRNQQINLKMDRISQEHDKLLEDKEQTDNVGRRLAQEVNDLNSEITDHVCDKKKMHKIIAHLEKVQADLQRDLNSSESQIEAIRQKCKHVENSNNDFVLALENAQKKLRLSQELVIVMKSQLDDNHVLVMNLESEISKLRQEIIAVEFQKSEVTLRLHKLQASLRTEQNINVELSAVNQKIVTEILKFDDQQPSPRSLKYSCESGSSSLSLSFTQNEFL